MKLVQIFTLRSQRVFGVSACTHTAVVKQNPYA